MASNSDAAQVAKPARANRSRSRSRSRRSAGTQAGRASGTACAAPSKEEAHEATSKGGRVGGAPATEQAPEKVADVDWQLTGMSEGQQIKQCAAFRVKYRLKDAAGHDLPLINIAPHLVAWHRKNRRGMFPNADRCQQLLHSYCGDWDPDEADHQSVAVQNKPGSTAMDDHNRKFRLSDERFAKCEQRAEVAAASHSHLNVMLHNVRGGAKVTWKVLLPLCNNERVSLDLVMAKDKEMGDHAQRGLKWEILDHKMEEEEPNAFLIIQAALNKKNSAAMVSHEMEHLNGLADTITDVGTGLADGFNWRMVRDRLMEAGNHDVAESPDFVGLLQVVTQALGGHAQGEGGYNHWGELKCWHEAMVNPKTRRARLATIAQLSNIPTNFPRSRNAFFRTAYSGKTPSAEKIKCGQVFMQAFVTLTHLQKQEWSAILRKTEFVLERWHIQYKMAGAFEHLGAKELHTLWAQVEPRLMAPCLRAAEDMNAVMQAVEEASKDEDDFVRRKVPLGVRRKLPATLVGSVASEAKNSTEVALKAGPVPVRLDAVGRAVPESDVVASADATVEEIVVAWEATETEGYINAARCAVVTALWKVKALQQTPPVQVLAVPGKKKPFHNTKVVVTRDVAIGELVLLPLVRGPEAVVTKTSHKASVISVNATMPSGREQELFILSSCHCAEKDRFMPPFWCAALSFEPNMKFSTLDLNSIETVLSDSADSNLTSLWKNNVCQFEVPIATNVRMLMSGEEVLLPKEKKVTEKRNSQTAVDWMTVAKRELREDRLADKRQST